MTGKRLGLALGLPLAFGGVLCLLLSGDRLHATLIDDVPIGVPFVLFALERWERPQGRPWKLEALVLAASLLRAVWAYPLVSGHALFLSYALLTADTLWLRAAAALVLGQVLYLKLVVWGDGTGLGGVLLGALAAALSRARRPTSSGR